ncbi:carboxypeptidase-like regulatory domain-containing protein [Flagellimonas lutimaris]|uniref:carboxypeptidase-like regulatory domain-containing protein n=1 Tax=Flagellimonas lutimaris TaxID=475082 RepID=UPI003F5CCD8B
MKKITFLLMLVSGLVSAQNTTQTISGIVTDGRVPLKNVKIERTESNNVQYTDANGHYTIEVVPGDKITYSYVGFKPIEILVEDVTRILNIEMFPDITELNEVTVTKSKRKSQQELKLEYNTNPNLIKTAYGIIDPETAAYQIRILSEEYISSVNLCILDVIRNEFPGVNVNGDCINGGNITVRGSNSISFDQSAIFDVDGQILTDAPTWILPANMNRIAVLTGFSAATKYGSVASGGVVIINTKTGNSYTQSKELMDKTRLRNNIYKGDALSSADLFNDLPVYLQELNQSKSFDEAKKIYEYYHTKYGSNYSYAIDGLRYFKENWNEEEFENSIVENTSNSFATNPIALKALAYVLQADGNFDQAFKLNREVYILRPNYAQSYMDLANSYRDLREHKSAASLYSRYDYLVNQGFLKSDSTAISTIITRELNNLLALNGNEIISKNVSDHVLEEDFNGTRLVFEWNDGEAEFELQFVNPEGHFFTFKHSIMENEDRIANEKRVGFSCEEFLIDNSLSGNWQVNVKYLGNKQLGPSYLKAVIYTNYGTPSQKKITKVFKMDLKGVNKQLFKVKSKFLQ